MYARPGPMKPVAEVGEKVLVIDRSLYKLYRVAYREQLLPSHPLVINLGALGVGATGAPFNTTATLDLNDGQLGQFRGHVLDDFHAEIRQPAQTSRFGIRGIIARFNAFARIEDPCDHLSEFFILEDDRIFITATNPAGYALAQARIGFYGFRYVLAGPGGQTTYTSGQLPPIATFNTIEEAMLSSHRPFTIVPVGGWTL